VDKVAGLIRADGEGTTVGACDAGEEFFEGHRRSGGFELFSQAEELIAPGFHLFEVAVEKPDIH
jgi:hypothetical protein